MIVTVREHARIRRSERTQEHSLDNIDVAEKAYAALRRLAFQKEQDNGPILTLGSDRLGEYLSVGSQVGLVCVTGLELEILPKTSAAFPSREYTRRILLKMVNNAYGLQLNEHELASMAQSKQPISELLFSFFLSNVGALVRESLAFDYREDLVVDAAFRGRVDFATLARTPPGGSPELRKTLDVWSRDRLENQIIKSALGITKRLSGSATQRARAARLWHDFEGIREHPNASSAIAQWDLLRSRIYKRLRSLCELVLGFAGGSPVASRRQNISVLFPMPQLFEKYVGAKIRKSADWTFYEQRQDRYLATLHGRSYFPLRPDYLAYTDDRVFILDAKWKLPETVGDNAIRSIQNSDVYQSLAYSISYREQSRETVVGLIYPRTDEFMRPFGPFKFADGSKLYILPFDIEIDELVWPESSPIPELA